MTTAYECSPLPPDSDDIRLLMLHPGDEADDIAVTLRSCPLAIAAGQYEALSYVWGSTEDPFMIEVRSDPLEGNSRLAITQNLAVALRHLRSREVPSILWVDAICIDQKNEQEKSKQVLRMSDIFRLASRVVIWLGPASSDSDLAIRLLHHQGSMVQFVQQRNRLVPTRAGECEPHWADTKEPLPYAKTECRAIRALFDRQWFERLWVVQEAVINPNTLVACGASEVAWGTLFNAMKSVQCKGSRHRRDREVRRLAHILGAFCQNPYLRLSKLVYQTRRMKCLDPRDRIYAVLSLARDGEQVKPDYTLNTIQVYHQLAMTCIADNSLNILRYCELGSRKLPGPTWIPDWSSPPQSRQAWSSRAAIFARASVELLDQGSIRVAAVHVGTLGRLEDAEVPLKFKLRPTVAQVLRWAPKHMETSVYQTGCSLLEAYCGTLVAMDLNRTWGLQDLPNLQTSVETVRLCLQWGGEGQGALPHVSRAHTKYLNMAYNATKHKTFVSTVEGYIGLAPASARAGDVVYAVMSCASLIVLRPVEGSEHQFQVVGEGFLYGLSNGEAVLGALPGHVRIEDQFVPKSGRWHTAYRNLHTNEVSLVDPRLLALGIHPGFDENNAPSPVSVETLEEVGVTISRIDLV